MIPEKLKKGDFAGVITPSRSLCLPWINEELRKIANRRFDELGLKLSFGKHVEETDEFSSSSIVSRVEDLHTAFSDKKVRLLITVIGGFNSNQILRYLDYGLIKRNPKILCGFSDITALTNAVYAKTGLITYSGPHYTYFGDKRGADYTIEHFRKCLFNSEPFEVKPSKVWSDDRWANNQNERNFYPNEGYWVINEGKAEGKIVGGNLCTLNLLQGTEYMPSLKSSILFIEDDHESKAHHFDRDLQSLIHLPDFGRVRGIVIGRFQRESEMTKELLTKIIRTKRELDDIPVIANADFGHTSPMFTFPIGGKGSLEADAGRVKLMIVKH